MPFRSVSRPLARAGKRSGFLSVPILNRQRRSELTIATIRRKTKLLLSLLREPSGVQLMLVDDALIRSFNRKFHLGNGATDVLAFETPSRWKHGRKPKSGLGEIVISVERVVANAKRFRVPPDEELVRCIAHGILHLLGERDDGARRKRKMWKRQEALIRRIKPMERIFR